MTRSQYNLVETQFFQNKKRSTWKTEPHRAHSDSFRPTGDPQQDWGLQADAWQTFSPGLGNVACESHGPAANRPWGPTESSLLSLLPLQVNTLKSAGARGGASSPERAGS